MTANVKNQLNPDSFTADEVERIHSAVTKKYSEVSASAAGFFTYTVGKEGAEALGYDATLLAGISDELLNSFCSVGNPFTIDPINTGNYVLDIGCGAGFDLYVASLLVGPAGKVQGVDLTSQMVDRARINLSILKAGNAAVEHISEEQLPFDDNHFDVVISNGVINLSPNKAALFAEIFRVIKPGGRLQFADIILEKELPPHMASDIESWSQ